nr:hypothetical protein [Tanacetum cinerariifolium]
MAYDSSSSSSLNSENDGLFSEEVVVLKREVACKDYEINVLKGEFEKVKQEKEGIEFKIEKFDNASKSLDKLIGSQITDNNKKGLRHMTGNIAYLSDFKEFDGGEANYVYKQSRMDRKTCYIKQKCVKSQSLRKFKRGRDIKIPQSGGPPKKVGDEAVHKELGDRMERAATTTSSLEAEQDSEDGKMKITATIDGRIKTITEASIRRHLKLEDSDGITTLPNAEIFEQLALMGYASDSDRLTFNKGHFSPQWRFFIHTILHCLSAKKTAWDQFSNNIATTIIFLATKTNL